MSTELWFMLTGLPALSFPGIYKVLLCLVGGFRSTSTLLLFMLFAGIGMVPGFRLTLTELLFTLMGGLFTLMGGLMLTVTTLLLRLAVGVGMGFRLTLTALLFTFIVFTCTVLLLRLAEYYGLRVGCSPPKLMLTTDCSYWDLG